MKTEPDPARKNGAYKWFIEELLERSKSSTNAIRVRRHHHPERTNDADLPLTAEEAERKEFFLGLTGAHREMLAKMFEEERLGAFHDVASFLEGYLSGYEMKIAFRDQEIPASPYWSMHYDLIALAAGDGWEDEQ